MARIPWRFTDPVTLEVYDWEVNANDGGSPSYRKTITYQNTAAPDGLTLMFEGRDEPKQTTLSGVILSEEQYNVMIEWYEKRRQVEIRDDLNRTFSIYITAFEPKRKRSYLYPWRHDYTLQYTIIDWAS